MSHITRNPVSVPLKWDDNRVVPGAFSFPGTADPALADWQPGGAGATFKLYEFAQADEVTVFCQIPHSYKEGGDLYGHVHWTPGDQGAAENGHTVAWKLDYTIISIDGTFLQSATIDMTDTCDGTDDKHQMTPDIQLAGTSGLGISSMMVGRLYRDNTDNWTGGVGSRPMILEFDLHYPKDDRGSNTSTAK